MPTPKPGQIRCPTCNRSTPPAAFCTQCGSPIPSSARIRPRGMDRGELDERIRTRRPGGVFRRGTPLDEDEVARQSGYVPFSPEPEDAQAARDLDPAQAPRNVDHMADEWEGRPAPAPRDQPVSSHPEPWRPEPEDAAWREQAAAASAPVVEEPFTEAYAPAADSDESWPDEEYAATPQPAYAYPATRERRGGGGALPILGFVALCVLALVVGALLAGALGGPSGVATGTSTPEPTGSTAPSVEPTAEPTAESSSDASSTAEPTDGPVTFPDGAVLTVQPCATRDMSFDGCAVDGTTINGSTMWVWIGFEDAAGADEITLTLESAGDTVDQQDLQLGDIVDCAGTCSGYIIGAAYQGLDPGDYSLVLRRNGDFADSAQFSVEG